MIHIEKGKIPIALFAADSSWGAASNFNEMFNSSGKYNAYEILSPVSSLRRTAKAYTFGKNMRDKQIVYNCNSDIKTFVTNPRTIFLIFEGHGMKLFKRCASDMGLNIKERCVNIFWSGTPYRKFSKKYNKWVKDNNVTAYAMLDLMRLGKNNLPLMQPYDVNKLREIRNNVKRSDNFIIGHSPGCKGRGNEKGTKMIQKVVSQIKKKYKNVKYEQIGNKSGKKSLLSHEDCIIKKAGCNVFIDQIASCKGGRKVYGLGKSGIESICLGVPTISALYKSQLVGRYKDLFMMCSNDEKDLYGKLALLIKDKLAYKEIENKTSECAHIFDYPTTLNYLEKTMSK
jgi:hypothetical protein